jgi:hypothetical protein
VCYKWWVSSQPRGNTLYVSKPRHILLVTDYQKHLCVLCAIRQALCCSITSYSFVQLLDRHIDSSVNRTPSGCSMTIPVPVTIHRLFHISQGAEGQTDGRTPKPGHTVKKKTPAGVFMYHKTCCRVQSGRGVALTTRPHLAPKFKKEYSYTSTHLLGLRGLLKGELLLCLTLLDHKTYM